MSKKVERKLFDQPQEVINRWFAIKAIRITRPYIERLYLFRLRVTLKRDARKRKILLEDTFNIILKKSRDFQHTKLSAPKQLYNIVLFFMIAERDLQAIKVDAFSALRI